MREPNALEKLGFRACVWKSPLLVAHALDLLVRAEVFNAYACSWFALGRSPQVCKAAFSDAAKNTVLSAVDSEELFGEPTFEVFTL
jgi:hypothetical protein